MRCANRCRTLQDRQREASETAQQAGHRLADIAARSEALAALQAKIGQGKDSTRWLEDKGLAKAHRLWQGLDIEPGWEDALEAVLRERLNAVEIERLDTALAWLEGRPGEEGGPPRIAVYARAPESGPLGGSDSADTLFARARSVRPEIARLLADWLRGVRCRSDVGAALRDRLDLSVGESFVTPQGHLVTAQSISFFAPDSDLHGVLARQRELAELEHAMVGAREAAVKARAALAAVETELDDTQTRYHAESMAFSSQQRRCHDLELELLQLKQAAEVAEKRRVQIVDELGDVAGQQRTEQTQETALARRARRGTARVSTTKGRSAMRPRHAHSEAEVAFARGRELVRATERAAQEAAFAERSCRERLAELERRRESLAAQVGQQRNALAQLTSERAAIDWTPVEEALQRQLAARGEAEQALAAARDRLEGLWHRVARGRGSPARRRAEARARARKDRGDAAQGAGDGARGPAVRGPARRSECGSRRCCPRS